MAITFQFRKEPSSFLGVIYRPVATILFQNRKNQIFKPVTLIVDTGADYTILPKFLADSLGVNLTKDCQKIQTTGVGGHETVYFCHNKITIKLGKWKKDIPLGFIDNNQIPPLLGRYEFLETFRVIFDKRQLTFIRSYKSRK